MVPPRWGGTDRLDSNFFSIQAKNEPLGKKISEKREGDGKKEKASNSDRYCSLRCHVSHPPLSRAWVFLNSISLTLGFDPVCIDRSANLKREDKGDRKDDTKKGEDGEKSKDQDDPKPGHWERVRTTKSGSAQSVGCGWFLSLVGCCGCG